MRHSTNAKVVRITYGSSEYSIFLTEDNTVEACVVFEAGKSIGNKIFFSALPWELRALIERTIDPESF